MPKFNLTCEHDGPVGSKNTLEFEAESLPTVLEHFRQFLKGCSFEFDGELEIVEVDYSYKLYKELEPDYDDEYAAMKSFVKVDVEWSTVKKAYFNYIEETNNEDDYDDKFKKFKSLVKRNLKK